MNQLSDEVSNLIVPSLLSTAGPSSSENSSFSVEFTSSAFDDDDCAADFCSGCACSLSMFCFSLLTLLENLFSFTVLSYLLEHGDKLSRHGRRYPSFVATLKTHIISIKSQYVHQYAEPKISKRSEHLDTLLIGDLPESTQKSLTCFNCKSNILLSFFVLISLCPFIKLAVDIWTIIIFLSSDHTASEKYSMTDQVHLIGLISVILLLFSTRSYVVFYCGTMDNRSLLMDNDVTKNLYRIIPFIGAPVANLIHDKYCFTSLVLLILALCASMRSLYISAVCTFSEIPMFSIFE